MNINWYPGHMAKAVRLIEESLPLADVIIYVLDSRAPYSCLNPVFDKLFASKKIIYALNKADLGAVSLVKDWSAYLSKDGSTSVLIDSTTSNSANVIVKIARNMCTEKLEKYKAKGVKSSIRAMVVGVPNCGKSTLINNLCGQGKTMTGNKPGVTKGKQWVRVNEYFEVLDTPGTLYPKLSDERVARHLAFLGSIKDEVTDTLELSLELLKELNDIDGNIILARYKTGFLASPIETLEQMAKNRGYILKGGGVDTERMSDAFLDDFRKGRLGKITLDKVSDYENN